MAREINTREIVCLSVLRGKSSKQTCEEVERETGRIYSQNYIDSLRSRAKNLIRMRCRELEPPPMSFAVLREIVEFSAKYDPPLTEKVYGSLPMPRILIRMLSSRGIKNGTNIICVHRLGVSSLTVGLGVSTRPPIFHLRLQNCYFS